MMLNLFLFLCLTGLVTVNVSHVRTVHHKYYLIKASATWSSAQSYCREKYTDLATVVTDEDWVRLKNETASKGLTSHAWIGLYNDLNSWRWSLNELPLKTVTYSKWNPGDPNNYYGRESCDIINGNGAWEDVPCTDLRPFICYNANFSGADKFIGISSPLLTWLQAQAYCRTHHTDLASALNSSDNDFIVQIRNIQGNSWIGLYRDTWKWSEGTITSNLPWSVGSPDNYGGIENCAVVYNGLFGDVPCNSIYYFFCHTILPVREQQIVRLQVKSDGSVLDPAVQSSILEQVKQKLAEKGMLENTTVTWRVQPDGNIFQKRNKDDL
ncbi:putative C-type lectin domain family 20 member A [Hemibagrus wyckioides]|uniref:putative C-type lectin domain family 20 member A n=1 Tax=Hemibagrus wyckioides TaxID=337641 RepID=UPI00266C7F37|nr:putative C-type lectin domain family 20 member A [Hemibagrus wyckioides]